SSGLTTLDGAGLPNSMLDSLKPYSDLGNEAGTFLGCEIDFTFLPSVHIGTTARCVPQGLNSRREVSVPSEKQRLLASKFGFGRLRRAQLLTRFKSSMEVSTKPEKKNCK
ncbi:MAG: hypothetical protein ABSF62_21695, partial [Bryobacteraceae bacterium]